MRMSNWTRILAITCAFAWPAFIPSLQAVTLSATEDTYVRDGTYATSNYGTSTTLQTKMADAGTGYTRHSYVKFNISTVSGTVTSAKLKLYGKASTGTGVTATHVYAVTDDTWTEGGMNWNNKPAASGSSLSNLSISSTTAAWYEWDVTSFVASEKTAGQTVVSLVVKHDLNCTPNNDFNSSEAASNTPILEVITGGNSAPSVSLTSPTSGSVYTAPASVPMAATASDSDGTVSKVEFYSGTSLLSTDTSAPYASTWSSVAAGTYSITAKATDNASATTTSGAAGITVNGAGSCGSASSGPTDNPVATKYGSTAYTWTDNIKWNCVFNVNDYSGANHAAKFNAARDAAVANGGGVVHFPSGTWTFSDHIYLKNGVVIRGANPSTSDAKVAGYAPPTKLHFPQYSPSLTGSGTANTSAFKFIYTTTPDSDSNIGVVNVDINRAGIDLQGNPDTGVNKNVVVLGVRQNNVSSPDAGIPTTWQNAWQRWPNRFTCNVTVQANSNVLIANNRLNDAVTDGWDQPNYKVKNGTTILTLTSGSQARYDFKDVGYIITANWKGGATWYSTPATEPSMFRTGIVVRDNYTFGTKSTAVRASGQNLLVKGNVRKDGGSSKYVWLAPGGATIAKSPDFNRNRGWDVGGYDYMVEDNDMEVYNHIVGWTPQYRCNDGESCHDNQGTLVNGATFRNNILRGGTVIMIYRTKSINNVLITNNTVLSDGGLGNNNSSNHSVFVWSDLSDGTTWPITNVRVQNNQLSQHIYFETESTSAMTGNVISGNTNPNANGLIKHSCESSCSISGNTGFTTEACN